MTVVSCVGLGVAGWGVLVGVCCGEVFWLLFSDSLVASKRFADFSGTAGAPASITVIDVTMAIQTLPFASGITSRYVSCNVSDSSLYARITSGCIAVSMGITML